MNKQKQFHRDWEDYCSKQTRFRRIRGWASFSTVICWVAWAIFNVIWVGGRRIGSSSSFTWIIRFNRIRGVDESDWLSSMDVDRSLHDTVDILQWEGIDRGEKEKEISYVRRFRFPRWLLFWSKFIVKLIDDVDKLECSLALFFFSLKGLMDRIRSDLLEPCSLDEPRHSSVF